MEPRDNKKSKGRRTAMPCRFCRDKISAVDYKDLGSLQKLVTSQGKQFSRKRSGNCARHQRSAKRALKRARFMALMGFTS